MAQKEYLKMSNFFYGELSANDDDGIGSIIDADGEYIMQAMENSHMASCSNKGRNEHRKLIAVASAHAINSHDELVAEVERLNKEIDNILDYIDEIAMHGSIDLLVRFRNKYVMD